MSHVHPKQYSKIIYCALVVGPMPFDCTVGIFLICTSIQNVYLSHRLVFL
jgi:hypothetical protein